mmetsp:Transcript_53900/g.58450  ORF Transcript_53900/g.58450 Transcript_53900/m.58450 type:complete len:81 (+) Transcript_53900:123-365(+)
MDFHSCYFHLAKTTIVRCCHTIIIIGIGIVPQNESIQQQQQQHIPKTFHLALRVREMKHQQQLLIFAIVGICRHRQRFPE